MNPSNQSAHREWGSFRPKAVLFDMDGVLFDSMPGHAVCWEQTFQKYGLHANAYDAFLHEGRTGEGIINQFAVTDWGREATKEEVAEIYAYKSQLFNQLPESKKMAGAQELLELVKQCGMKILVVTGSGQASLLSRLETNYPGIFKPEWIVSSKDCERGKPFPDPYLLGLEHGGISASEAIVVENAPLGVEAAVKAGIFTVGVNTGPLPEQLLAQAGASVVLPSMSALAELWRTTYL